MKAPLRWMLRQAELRPDPRETAFHDELLRGVRGVVVEVGCGRGRLFPRYPPAVERLIGIEPDAPMRAAATEAAGRLRFPAEVRDGDAAQLPVEDAAADVVVFAE